MSTNYRADFFPHDNLSVIIGQPDYESLHKMKKQLKANAMAVPSTLGGGQHGLLGLVLTPAEYAIISAVPFVREAYPGALLFPVGTSNVQSRMLEDAYKKRMKNYEACVGVEKALIQQIVKAVHEDWLKPLYNAQTDTIQGTVQDILTYLFQTYGHINARALNKKENTVKEMSYDPVTDPMDNIFTEVQELMDFATAAGAPYSREQIINIAYNIIGKHRVFNDAIIRWDRLIRANAAHNTWLNFRTHFRDAYQELKDVGELRVADTQFNQANLVSQIVDAVTENLQAIPAPPPTVEPPFYMPQQPSTYYPPQPSYMDYQANNAATMPAPMPPSTPSAVPTMDPMNTMMQQMMMMMMNNNSNNNQNGNNNGNNGGREGRGRGRGRGRGGRGGRGGGRNNQGTRPPRLMRYCWSCGWQTHDGEHCYNQRPGHQAQATVENRMGGSDAGFPPGCE